MKIISLFVRYSGSNISAIGMVVVSVLLTLQFFSTFSFKASLSKRAVVAAFNSLPASLRKEENDVKYCWKGCLIKMSMWIFIMQSNSINVTSGDCLNYRMPHWVTVEFDFIALIVKKYHKYLDIKRGDSRCYCSIKYQYVNWKSIDIIAALYGYAWNML